MPLFPIVRSTWERTACYRRCTFYHGNFTFYNHRCTTDPLCITRYLVQPWRHWNCLGYVSGLACASDNFLDTLSKRDLAKISGYLNPGRISLRISVISPEVISGQLIILFQEFQKLSCRFRQIPNSRIHNIKFSQESFFSQRKISSLPCFASETTVARERIEIPIPSLIHFFKEPASSMIAMTFRSSNVSLCSSENGEFPAWFRNYPHEAETVPLTRRPMVLLAL